MLSAIPHMLQIHPAGAPAEDQNVLAVCVEACFHCVTTCTVCADACLAEPKVEELIYCIRTNLDCADICLATGRMVARQTKPDRQLMQAQLHACITACQVCGETCAKHGEMHEHCQICADICHNCEMACQDLLAAILA